MYYVAATRARDLLVGRRPAHQGEKMDYATRALASGAHEARVERFSRAPAPRAGLGARRGAAAARPIIGDAALQQQLDAVRDRFRAQLAVATQPIARPHQCHASARRRGG